MKMMMMFQNNDGQQGSQSEVPFFIRSPFQKEDNEYLMHERYLTRPPKRAYPFPKKLKLRKYRHPTD